MDILIEKTINQYRKILWIGNDHLKLLSILEKSKPECYTEIKDKLSNGYDIKKDVEIDNNISMPIWDSKSKSIVDISVTPEYIEQQKINEGEKLIHDEMYKKSRDEVITDLQSNNKLDENLKPII